MKVADCLIEVEEIFFRRWNRTVIGLREKSVN